MTGLVLEGGAMRGLFTAGVLDVLMENGIEFDGAVGVSAGACFGCNYKSKQIGRVLRYNLAYCRDKRYCSLYSLIKTGELFGADFCYRELPEKLDIFDTKTYKENPMEFHVVCTDIDTGKPVYIKCRNGDSEDLNYIRASASMPFVSKPVVSGKKRLLDGGIADAIPLAYFESLGYDRNIVILTRPKGYKKDKSKAFFLMRPYLKKFPKLLKVMENRHEAYNRQTEYAFSSGAFVLYPPENLPIGRICHDPKKIQAVYSIGRKTAEDNLNRIKDYLKGVT